MNKDSYRHIKVFEFFKLLLLAIEECRKDYHKGYDFVLKAVQYIKRSNKNLVILLRGQISQYKILSELLFLKSA